MVFYRLKEHKKKSGTYIYCYRVENKREGKKVKQKVLEYLGTDLKKCLEENKS